MFDAVGVMSAIKGAGIKVLDYSEGDDNDCVDGSVILTKATHVQVGPTYLCLVKETSDGCFEWLHQTQSLENMIYFIRTYLMQGKI